jgi:hypothetical protein
MIVRFRKDFWMREGFMRGFLVAQAARMLGLTQTPVYALYAAQEPCRERTDLEWYSTG